MLPRFDLFNVYGHDVPNRLRVLTGCKATCTKYLKRTGGRIEWGVDADGNTTACVWFKVDPRYCTPGLPNNVYERYVLVPVVDC